MTINQKNQIKEEISNLKNVFDVEEEIKKILDQEFTNISKREKKILESRIKKKTLKAIGEEFGLTLERIRQIEKRAKQKKQKEEEVFNKAVKEIIKQLKK